MSQLTHDPIGRPVPQPRDRSARDGGALVPCGVIPRDVIVSAAGRRAAPKSRMLPLTPYDDPAHLRELAARDWEARRGQILAFLLTAVLTSLAYCWLP